MTRNLIGASLALAVSGLALPALAEPAPSTTPTPASEPTEPTTTTTTTIDPVTGQPVTTTTTPTDPASDPDYRDGYRDGVEDAEGPPKVVVEQKPVVVETRSVIEDERRPFYLTTISLGGGVTSFVREEVRDSTGTAGDWDARVAFGTSLPLAFEAAYIGSAQTIDAIGLDGDALLVGNGVEGAVRLQLPLTVVQPYLVAGAAWRHYEIANADTNTSDIADEDDVLEVPLGVGVGFHQLGLAFDVRATYRHAFEDDLMGGDADAIDDEIDSSRGDLHRIGVNLMVGMDF